MKYIVDHRNSSGGRVKTIFEADSRSSLFKQLKDKGISAVSVREATQRDLKSSAKNKKLLIVIALIVICIIAVCCILFSRQSNLATDMPSNTTHKGYIKEISQSNVGPCVAPIEKKSEEPEFAITHDGRKIYRNPTNDIGRVVTNAFGKTYVIERVVKNDGPTLNGQSIVPRRIFTYDSEVAIDTLMNMEIGYKSLMMLPKNMDEDFQNSMASKIEILPEDTEDEIRRKNEMISIKKELAERVANGEKVSQIAAETLAQYNKIADKRDMLLQEVIKAEDEGVSGEDLEELYEAANIMLKEYDALPLHSPKVRKAIIRERLERNRNRH